MKLVPLQSESNDHQISVPLQRSQRLDDRAEAAMHVSCTLPDKEHICFPEMTSVSWLGMNIQDFAIYPK
jgi:hypothetical protein